MAERQEFEITGAQLDTILEASKPVPYMVVGGVAPASPQENANRAWAALGREIGFDYMTVKPVAGKGQRCFTAEITEREEQEVPYYGYVEVTVKLMRQGHGEDSSGEPGSGFGVHAERTLRIEEYDARAVNLVIVDGPMKAIREAISGVLDEDKMVELRLRWNEALQRKLSPEQMEQALAILEGRA